MVFLEIVVMEKLADINLSPSIIPRAITSEVIAAIIYTAQNEANHSCKEPQTMNLANQSPVLNTGSRSCQTLYLVFAILSCVISWGIFLQFLLSGNASIAEFFHQCFATHIASLLSSDILISFVILTVFSAIELKRLDRPSYWVAVYIAATWSVGVCFGLSLFLYQRETWRLESNN